MVGRKILDVPGTLKSYKVPELSSFLSINPRKYTAGFSLAPLQKKKKKNGGGALKLPRSE